ncbi:MAG TPA: sulfatase [Abditibacteriaceae bacterium]|nr:sulfatase [Abditibacteriaceae bacterium]
MKQPNILYIHSHDTGRYIEPYGHLVPTPRLQRLARAGVLFRQAFCAAPTCSPSRAALLTGQWPHSAGMLGLAHRNFGFALDDYSRHLLHTLRAAGYSSTLIGTQHIAKDAEVIGYDDIVPVPGNHARHVVPATVQWLQNAPLQPLFLDVGFSETHRSFHQPSPSEDAGYCMPPAPLPDTPEIRQDMAAFKASARVLDEAIGNILDALELNGLLDNTLIIYTTDHGIAFPAMKCNVTDHGLGVALIMRGPASLAGGAFSGGRVYDSLVSQIDIFPTLCELLQIAPPPWLQGRSLLPLLRGEAAQINDAIFAEINFHGSFEPQRAVRTTRWKYIRRYDGRRHPLLLHCDGSPSKEYWVQQGWADQPVVDEQLYDLVFDPNEAANRAGDPALAGVLEEMRDRLNRWMRETDDPLLQEVFPVPADANLHHPDCASLEEPPVEDTRQFVDSILRSGSQHDL